MQRVVDGNRASRRKRYALGADGLAVIGQPGDPEKHKRSVLASHFLRALRIRAHPLTDALKRHLLARDDLSLDENAADWNVRVSVVSIVGDAQHRSVFQSHPGRALDLNHQSIRRIFDPADLEMLAVKGAVEDLATIVVGHEFAAGCTPQRLSSVGKPGADAVWRRHQIARATVDRDFED